MYMFMCKLSYVCKNIDIISETDTTFFFTDLLQEAICLQRLTDHTC